MTQREPSVAGPQRGDQPATEPDPAADHVPDVAPASEASASGVAPDDVSGSANDAVAAGMPAPGASAVEAGSKESATAAPVRDASGTEAVTTADPNAARRRAAARQAPDPFETAPLPVAPPSADQPVTGSATVGASPAAWPSDGTRSAESRAPTPRSPDVNASTAGLRSLSDEPLADDRRTTHLDDVAEEPGIFDDAPTETLTAVGPAGGRHRVDPEADADPIAEWRAPRPTSRLTTGLVVALLVALGFLAGVFVGRSAGGHTTGNATRPAATATVRPGTLR